jgi:hypothetical protein
MLGRSEYDRSRECGGYLEEREPHSLAAQFTGRA